MSLSPSKLQTCLPQAIPWIAITTSHQSLSVTDHPQPLFYTFQTNTFTSWRYSYPRSWILALASIASACPQPGPRGTEVTERALFGLRTDTGVPHRQQGKIVAGSDTTYDASRLLLHALSPGKSTVPADLDEPRSSAPCTQRKNGNSLSSHSSARRAVEMVHIHRDKPPAPPDSSPAQRVGKRGAARNHGSHPSHVRCKCCLPREDHVDAEPRSALAYATSRPVLSAVRLFLSP
jgi:hypothetical protein